MILTSFPLMAIALIVYNGLAFGLGGGGGNWDTEILSVPMMSGARWSMTMGDAMIIFSLFLLFFEILKATRIGRMSIIDHLLSTLILIVFLVEFLLVPAAATGTFFIIMMMVLVDVMAGFTVSIRSATRDVSLGGDGL